MLANESRGPAVIVWSLRGTQALSNVDEGAHGGFEMVVHSCLKAELKRGRTAREARTKTGWEDGPIYTASQDLQVDRREAYFGKRAQGAKIGPSEEVREGGSKKRC